MISVWLCATACADYEIDETRAVVLDAQVFAEAREAWIGWGGADPSACPLPRELLVDADEFQSACGRSSCFAQETAECAWACTVHSETSHPVIVRQDASAIGHTPEHERAHEVFHVWSFCTRGDPDADHTNFPIWYGAMREVDGETNR